MSDCAGYDLVQHLGDRIKTRVSSVINKDVKEYGKKFMFDGREDTCWNSDQGDTQVISFSCECPVVIKKIHIQFQGGFAGKDCKLEIQPTGNGEVITTDFYPEDGNQMQIFEVDSAVMTKSFKLHFLGSTDFFGRIIIYQLKIIGDVMSS